MVAQPGMRIALKRESSDKRDRCCVAVESLDERTLGYLPVEVAAWVAPLLGSEQVAIDGRIYAVEPATPGSNRVAPSFYVSLTQFELFPIKRSALIRGIQGLLSAPFRSAKWCVSRVAMLHQATGLDGPSGDRFATDEKAGR
jgi:hypothetical protein